MTKVITPQPGSNTNLLNKATKLIDSGVNLNLNPYKPIGLEIINPGDTTVLIKPSLDIDRNPKYLIWCNNKILSMDSLFSSQGYWTVDINTSNVKWDSTQKIGYRVDGSTYAGSGTYVNLWAFFDDDLTIIQGFAATAIPSSSYSGVSSGNLGSEATFTGMTNAYAYDVGATVLVTNTTEWNRGVITQKVSNTSIKAKMYSALSGFPNTNITSTTGSNIIQIDKYYPWNGRVDTSEYADLIFMKNYRLIWNNLIDTWHYVGGTGEPAFQNSWVNNGGGYEPVAFLKNSNGQVFLKGLTNSGTTTALTVIYNLPHYFRPYNYLQIGTTSNTSHCEMRVDPNGNIVIIAGASASYLSFEGMNFKTF